MESTESWAALLRDLKRRGLRAPKVVIGDGHLGIWGALTAIFPEVGDTPLGRRLGRAAGIRWHRRGDWDVFLTKPCLPEDLEGHARRLLEGKGNR